MTFQGAPETTDMDADSARLYPLILAKERAFNEQNTGLAEAVRPLTQGLSSEVATALYACAVDLYMQDVLIRPLEPPPYGASEEARAHYRLILYAKQNFYNNPHLLESLKQHLVASLKPFVAVNTKGPSPFKVPLAFLLPDTREALQQLILSMSPRGLGNYLMKETCDQIRSNVFTASGYDARGNPLPGGPRVTGDFNHTLTGPKDSKLPLDDMLTAYLKNTPYLKLAQTLVPLPLTHEDRFAHMHVLGGSGAGKTSLIETLLLDDLKDPSKPSVVAIDPHSDLINRLIRADLGISDRLIYINPRDTEHPVAINIFALNQERMAGYDDVTREQVTAGVIQTFDFLFSSLFELDLSGKQQVFFRYVTRLMLSLPQALGRNATILDMLALMQDVTPYLPAIRALPPIQRDFFDRDFMSKTFAQTKEQIRYRLQAIIENPTLARLFTSTETKVDFFTELNRGAVILIDTAKDFLKDGSSIFGQVCLSLILQAIQERAAVAEKDRKHTFIYVDEAADAFSSNIDNLLTDARKYKAGLVLSHQYLDQATSSLRASMAANTGSKFVSGVSAGDARAMASELRTTADFILNQPQLQFAVHIRNVTPHALSIPIVPGAVARLPRLSQDAFDALLTRNRTRVSLEAPSTHSRLEVAAVTHSSPPPAEGKHNEW